MTAIRRSQLLTPFGPGALLTDERGTTLLVSAIDLWYPSEEMAQANDKLELEDFHVEEPRLSARLGVSRFRLPPDYNYRRPVNAKLALPAQRFPNWHVCPHAKCGRLKKASPTDKTKVLCSNKEQHPGKKDAQMHQVRFVMMCDHGHVADFPWNEWVHGSVKPDNCKGQGLRLFGGGGADLGSIKVLCNDCGKERTLKGILSANRDTGTTELSQKLDKDGITFKCPGHKPWAVLTAAGGEHCPRPVQGSLLNANNLHYSEEVSSIYLPPADSTGVSDELLRLVNDGSLSTMRMAVTGGMALDIVVPLVRATLKAKTKTDHGAAAVGEALKIACGLTPMTETEPVDAEDPVALERAFRRAEYTTLGVARSGELLTTRTPDMGGYAPDIRKLMESVTLVDRLRETRVLTGITRVQPGGRNPMNEEQRRNLLWANTSTANDWLPAAVTYGEGIFLRFDTNALATWEKEVDDSKYLAELMRRYKLSPNHQEGHLAGPRHVLLHTFSHLLLNQLVYECGYSAASLRERLYVSRKPGEEMAGILIYTAAGDSEGTMGGLVSCGEPGSLEPIIRRAVAGAEWCAADPICGEAAVAGQGPDSCNLAACHNCALVPETSCEEFNRFLDRTCVVGGKNVRGYFQGLLNNKAE